MFALSLISIYLDRAAVGGIAATVALAMIILIKLPIVESFEMLTLKVKLRHQVDEAGDLIRQIRSTASVTSKLLYLQLGFMNRMGSVSWSQKRQLLAEIDQMLGNLEVPRSEIDEWKRPFMNLIMRDLLAILWGAIRHLKQRHLNVAQSALEAYKIANSPIMAGDPEYARLCSELQRFHQPAMEIGDVLQGPALRDLSTLTEGWIAQDIFAPAELFALETMRSEIIEYGNECWGAGSITTATESYLDRHSDRTDTRISEILSDPAALGT